MKTSSFDNNLWVELYNIVKGKPIDGSDPERKDRWLSLALACGLQLASELGLQDISGKATPLNDALAGEVFVYGNIVYNGPRKRHDDEDDSYSLVVPVQLFFVQPETTDNTGFPRGRKFFVRIATCQQEYSLTYEEMANEEERVEQTHFLSDWLTGEFSVAYSSSLAEGGVLFSQKAAEIAYIGHSKE